MPEQQPESILELRDVCAGYKAYQVLDQVNLTVNRGSVVTVIGANGAGKTTTLNVISGVVPVSAGQVLLDGEPIKPASHSMVARGVAHSPEGRRMFPHMTVLENLMTGAYASRDKEQIRTDLDMVLDLFPILRERSTQKAGTLSGGEQQMAAIARALMSHPRLLLLDEPTLGLAPKMVGTVRDIIGRIAETGLAILLVEQNANMALDLAEYGYVLENGKVVLHGASATLRSDERVRAAYLTAA
jgi:branched-chain amino acid transport system ATP-binding protein